MHLARRKNELVGPLVLHDSPHALDVVARKAPVAERVYVAHVKLVLEPHLDAADGPGDLARHKRLAAARRLVVEEYSVRGKDAVRLAVVADGPVRVELRNGVGRARVERSRLLLRDFLHEAEELGGGRLVELGELVAPGEVDRFEKPHSAERVHISRELRRVERDAHVALRGEIVDFVGLYLVDELHEVRAVREVSVVEKELNAVYVRVLVEVVYPLRIERRGAADYAVDFIALFEQQLREIAAVLPRNASDECFLHIVLFPWDMYYTKFQDPKAAP